MSNCTFQVYADVTKRHAITNENIIIYDVEIYSEALAMPRIIHISGNNRTLDQIHDDITHYAKIVLSTNYKRRISQDDMLVEIHDITSE